MVGVRGGGNSILQANSFFLKVIEISLKAKSATKVYQKYTRETFS
jgi:hypothetical protein